MIVKKHSTPNGLMLAVCDDELLGNKYSDEERDLDLTGAFYKGEAMSEENLLTLAKDAYIMNIVGEKSISVVSKLYEVGKIVEIDGIKHAQVLCIRQE